MPTPRTVRAGTLPPVEVLISRGQTILLPGLCTSNILVHILLNTDQETLPGDLLSLEDEITGKVYRW